MAGDDPRGHARQSVSRRDFLRVVGGALGGVALTSAGSTGNGGGSLGAIPNGYVFYRVWTANDGAAWPGDPGFVNPVGDMTPVTMMAGGTPYIYFHAHLTQAATDDNTSLGKGANPPDALVLVSVDYTRTPPVVSDLRVWVYQGVSLTTPNITGVPTDQLPLLISRIGTGDTNAAGHYATTLTCTDLSGTVAVKNAPGVYLIDPETKVWSRVARFGDPAPEGGQYGGIFGDVALADDDTVTFVGSTTDTSAGSLGASQALFSVDRKHPTRQSRVLLRAGDLLPGTNAAIRSFGLIDVAGHAHDVAPSRAHVPQSARRHIADAQRRAARRAHGGVARRAGRQRFGARVRDPVARRRLDRPHGVRRTDDADAAAQRRLGAGQADHRNPARLSPAADRQLGAARVRRGVSRRSSTRGRRSCSSAMPKTRSRRRNS